MMLRLQSLAVALTTAVVVASQTPAAPDLILVNGRVFTADARVPWAEAVAVRRDRIVDVGTNAAVWRSRAARSEGAYTAGSAFAGFAGNDKGRIAAGMLADL